MGRPSDYSLEVVTRICARLVAGEPLVKICRDEEMPSVATVYVWQLKHPEFVEMYARAREDQADTLADEIIDIADEDPASVFTTEGRGDNQVNVERVDGATVAHQRLRVDARKWVASKLKPRKYGDKVELTGKDGEDLIPRKVHVYFPDAKP